MLHNSVSSVIMSACGKRPAGNIQGTAAREPFMLFLLDGGRNTEGAGGYWSA
jgi:hypothetical protein